MILASMSRCIDTTCQLIDWRPSGDWDRAVLIAIAVSGLIDIIISELLYCTWLG